MECELQLRELFLSLFLQLSGLEILSTTQSPGKSCLLRQWTRRRMERVLEMALPETNLKSWVWVREWAASWLEHGVAQQGGVLEQSLLPICQAFLMQQQKGHSFCCWKILAAAGLWLPDLLVA